MCELRWTTLLFYDMLLAERDGVKMLLLLLLLLMHSHQVTKAAGC